MLGLILLALLAPPTAPIPHERGLTDCYTQDLREGHPVSLDCDGLVLGRAQALTAIDATQYARQLREQRPSPAPVPWYDRPTAARIEGGALATAAILLGAYAVRSAR
jgi:hypothetical protein